MRATWPTFYRPRFHRSNNVWKIYSMVQNIISKADCHSACQKISCFLYGI